MRLGVGMGTRGKEHRGGLSLTFVLLYELAVTNSHHIYLLKHSSMAGWTRLPAYKHIEYLIFLLPSTNTTTPLVQSDPLVP